MRGVKWLVIVNIIILASALFLASLGWAPHGEEELPAAGGDIFVRVLCVLPLFLFMSILNVVWTIRVIARICRDGVSRHKVESISLLIVITTWIVAVVYDHSRQYLG